MISINNISKYYGKKKVLDNISCTFDTGINSILGPNGAGKTTLMNIICNTIKCQNGEVYYDNTPIIKLEEKYRKDLSVLFQNNPVYPNYTAKEYLKFVGILKGMDKERIETEISRTLDLVNLSDECNKKIKSFSGGMRQRLGIAQALMNTPKIIIFDEPSVGLDPKEREQFKRIIYKLKMNSIIIISTHIVSDIDKISDTITIMNKGKIIVQGNQNDLIKPISGAVWHIPNDELNSFKDEDIYFDDSEARMISVKQPSANSIRCQESLNDAYFYYTSNKKV